MDNAGSKIVFDEKLNIEVLTLTGMIESLPPHFHDYYELGYIESGSRRVICQGKEYTIGKNDLLLFNPNDNHTCLELKKEMLDFRCFHITTVAEFMAKTAEAKMAAGFLPLLSRGILCNILVCVAVWCGFKCKSEAGKLIMIFWCLFVFITAGFEHSIANMTLLTVGLLEPSTYAVTIGGFVYNLLVVTLGNMIGGILFVAVPYCIIAKQKQK